MGIEWPRWNVSLVGRCASVAGGAGPRSAAGHAAKAGTNTIRCWWFVAKRFMWPDRAPPRQALSSTARSQPRW
jgi:hypothetical protein